MSTMFLGMYVAGRGSLAVFPCVAVCLPKEGIMVRHGARVFYFACVLIAEEAAARSISACPTMQSFRHCHIVKNQTIVGTRHLVLRGHCSGPIVVRAGFTATQKLEDTVQPSDLLQHLEGLEHEVFVPELQQALRHVRGSLHLQSLRSIRREAQAVAAATAVGQLHHGVNTAIDVCTLTSPQDPNLHVRLEVYKGFRCSVLHWLQENTKQGKKQGKHMRCSLPPQPFDYISFFLLYLRDLLWLEEAGSGHPDPRSGNSMLRRAARYVWTDLGSSNSVDVTERVNVFRRYLRDLASLASQANKHVPVGRVLDAFYTAANESATTPRMLCRQVLGSILQAVAHESWDFQQQVIKEVQFSMLSVLQSPADALSQGKDTLPKLLSQHDPDWL